MAAASKELGALHSLVTAAFKQRLEQDAEDNIPTDAATLGALIKFLKDNNITADASDQDDLHELREQLVKAGERKRASVLALVKEDLKVQEG